MKLDRVKPLFLIPTTIMSLGASFCPPAIPQAEVVIEKPQRQSIYCVMQKHDQQDPPERTTTTTTSSGILNNLASSANFGTTTSTTTTL